MDIAQNLAWDGFHWLRILIKIKLKLVLTNSLEHQSPKHNSHKTYITQMQLKVHRPNKPCFGRCTDTLPQPVLDNQAFVESWHQVFQSCCLRIVFPSQLLCQWWKLEWQRILILKSAFLKATIFGGTSLQAQCGSLWQNLKKATARQHTSVLHTPRPEVEGAPVEGCDNY